jgi:Holliday junction resolvasome RuvABC endonuclease subunit
MARLLALDLGTRTGWALLQRGTPPSFGTLDLPPAKEGEHQVRFAMLHAWLVRMREQKGFDALAFEQPILPRRAGELATTMHTLTLLWGLAAVTQLFAGQQSLPCEAVAVRDAKKALTDKALATKDEMVVAALQVMNWKVANDHEADAGAVGLVAYERLWPRIGPRSLQR